MSRVIGRGLCLFAACLLLAGCPKDKPSTPPETPSGRSGTASTTDVGVTLHMTGLLLFVPPKTSPGPTNVLLPLSPPGEKHLALLGVGIDPGSEYIPRLCLNYQDAIDKAICYVKLDEWSLDPIGTGGTTVTLGDLASLGAVNVTAGSGGPHRVDMGKLDARIRSQVVLNGGKPGKSCPLGLWTYQPPGQSQPDSVPSANVMRWELTLPEDYELVFRLKANPNSTIRLPLVADGQGHVDLLLAHLPEKELKDLPPTQGTTTEIPPSPHTAPKHFHAFYELLSTPGSQPGQVTSMTDPLFERATSNGQPCVVNVTSPLWRALQVPPGVRTFACVPASAEPGP